MAKRDKNATVDLGLRVQEPLRAKLQRAASRNERSMNAEIVGRLEASFSSDRASDLVALAMWMETVEGGKNWKDDRLTAETVRIAVDRIIAGIAGLPLQHPTPAEIREVPELSTRADSLARAILRRSGFKYPVEKSK